MSAVTETAPAVDVTVPPLMKAVTSLFTSLIAKVLVSSIPVMPLATRYRLSERLVMIESSLALITTFPETSISAVVADAVVEPEMSLMTNFATLE